MTNAMLATVLGALVVSSPVPIDVCDLEGCRTQTPNTFVAGCRVAIYASVSASGTRARWTVTAHREDGLLSSVVVSRSFGPNVLWSGSQAYWTTTLLSTTQGANWLQVHAEDGQACVTDTRFELRP